MKIGFIGLGNMGLPMARNLVKAGHDLTVYNRTLARIEGLGIEGVQIAKDPAETCAADVLITMLANDQAVDDVVLENHLISKLPQASIHISMSTISVALAEWLSAAHQEAGSQFISAPVLGRPQAAEAAALSILAAGSADAIARCQPLFDTMGHRTFILGDKPSKANVIKLALNFLIASAIESLGEAFTLVRKSEIHPAQFLEILTGTAFDTPLYRNYGSMIADRKFEPAGFRLSLGLKDVNLVLAAAEGFSVPMPIASVIRDRFVAAMARDRQDLDWSAVATVSAESAGLS